MAKTIPADEKVFMVSKTTNTTYSGSAALKAMNEWYTMDDVTNTVRPYKVYTALLTQSGGSDIPAGLTSGDLVIGVTYTIGYEGPSRTADFTNVGAPNNESNTNFVATGTTPNSWGVDAFLEYNTGAPVATVLENTIGNIWFSYSGVGVYLINSNGLFTSNKTTTFIQNTTDDANNNSTNIGYGSDFPNNIQIITASNTEGIFSNFDGLLYNTPIEVRVYS